MSKLNWLTRFAAALCLTTVYFGGNATPAHAGDLGGSCCNDLEERVSELEATTARKGNRRISVSVYGQVNKALMWIDSEHFSDTRAGENATSGTRLGFVGEGAIASEWKAGYKLEFGINDQPTIPIVDDDQIKIRHSFWWIEGPVGRVSAGLTSMATDGIAQITVANTDVASRILSLQPISSTYLFGIDLPFNDLRRNVVRYDAPSMGGLKGSASWAAGDLPLGIGGFGNQVDDAWDVALRYAGEFAGLRVAGGIGLSQQNGAISPLLGIPDIGPDRVVSGSASVLHTGSGLFGTVGWGFVDGGFLGDYKTAHIQGGWQQNVTGLGATTIFGEYAFVDPDKSSQELALFGLGVVQAIDAAALDLYATWRQYDLDNDDRINVLMTGARLRF